MTPSPLFKPLPSTMSSLRLRPLPWLALLLAFSLSGCVWLRLLELKNQLTQFDRHFRVEVADQHFILHLRDPVLLSEDFTDLTKLKPSRVGILPQGYRWFLDFAHDPAAQPQKDQRLIFAMSFTQDGKLSAFDFPPLFLQMAPVAFLEASIRSLGLGKVDQGKQQLKVDPEDLPKLTGKLPSQKAILDALGPPTERATQDGLQVLLYRFKAQTTPVDPDYEKRRLAEAKLFFDPAKDELVRLSGRFVGLKIAIDYRKLRRPEDEKTADRQD